MTEAVNAKITKTMLGYEDHGILTCFLVLDFGGISQSFGGYELAYYGLDMIEKIMKVVGVSEWENLQGKYIRVIRLGGKIISIGNLIEDKWYTPEG